ncbi:MAG: amino acid permease [Lentisphaerales bacterium]|nr:amino acid permease [Lentisphaerales bacterium]
MQVPTNKIPSDSTLLEGQKFGTFHGVFRPTLLTIIGVMLYLREGWLVGNAGLFGAILVILTAYLITGMTALSISSITSNTRVGAGGVFSLVSQSLGLEMGGAIGIPLFLAQGLSAAMYIHGFIEGWYFLYPEHYVYQPYIILILFTTAFLLVYVSTKLAFKVQLLVMLLIIGALLSMYAGAQETTRLNPEVWGSYSDTSFWGLFAVFFPAATGIMVGASMSGSLENPKKSIPIGTMGAWLPSLAIYLLAAVYYSMVATPEELRAVKTIGLEKSKWPQLVALGLICSCFTATLSSLAAAPRVLQALAEHKIVPGSGWLKREKNGEPHTAMLFTGAMVLVAALAGDLNTIARILTMFFLLTYLTINVVLFIEQSLNLISFRPEFRIPKIVPILGSVCCLTAIIVISPLTGLISISIIIALYIYLDRKQLETPWETVHSGLLVSIANWAAKKVCVSQNKAPKRSWKPDMMVPVENDTFFEGQFRLLKALCHPQGSVQAVGLVYDKDANSYLKNLEPLIHDMQKEDIFASTSTMQAKNYAVAISAAASVMNGSFFHPNTIFETVDYRSQEELESLIQIARNHNMAAILMARHQTSGLGRERTINLWVRDQSPDWKLDMKRANLDYAILLSYQLQKNWDADVRLLCVVEKEENKKVATQFLKSLMDVTRMTSNIKIHVSHGQFIEYLSTAPRADLNIFGVSHQVNRDMMLNLMKTSRSSCLFVMDSGNESALA